MKKLILFISLFFTDFAYAAACSNPVTITCPLVQTTISYGSTICTSNDISYGQKPQAKTVSCDGNQKYSWRVWLQQSNPMSVNTMTDSYYGADPSSTMPGYPSNISCTGGWKPDGNYVLYSFTLQNASYESCMQLGMSQFSCCL